MIGVKVGKLFEIDQERPEDVIFFFLSKVINNKVKAYAQPCLTLCNPTDYSLPGSSVCGILQARILE